MNLSSTCPEFPTGIPRVLSMHEDECDAVLLGNEDVNLRREGIRSLYRQAMACRFARICVRRRIAPSWCVGVLERRW